MKWVVRLTWNGVALPRRYKEQYYILIKDEVLFKSAPRK